jgi:putative heme-binding domain-containing protein
LKQAAAPQPENLIQNGSFEQAEDGRPRNWRPVTHNGRGELTLGNMGHTGSRSARIASTQGGDISWATRVMVKPRTDYQLTAWVKTENVQRVGGARGALLNIHELQDPVHGATKPLVGDNDWTRVDLVFNSGQLTEITVNCLFGGWGRATGVAYFDDVELKPASGGALPGEVGRVVRIVTSHYAHRGPVDSIVDTLQALSGASADLAVPILDGLVEGWPEDKAPTLSAEDKRKLTALMDAMPESVRDRLLALSQRWNQPDLFGANIAAIIESLKKQVADGSAPEDKRVAAAKRLTGIESSNDIIGFILQQISTLSSPTFAGGLINALNESRSHSITPALLESWSRFTPATRRNAVAAMMRRPASALDLLNAVEKNTISRGDIATDQWSQLKTNPDRAVSRKAERLMQAGNAISADREEIVKKLLPLAKEKGDVARGREVFATACLVCHVFNGEGGKVGPDLNGIGARDRTEILTDILDPNRSVEANYRLWNVTTKSGDTFSGRLDTETQTTIEILDTTAQKHVIARKDIASMEGLQTSIMPAGFEALPPEDLTALMEYLCKPH